MPIYKEEFFNVKIEIYYQTIRVITKYKSNYTILQKKVWPNLTALEKLEIKNLLIICTNKNIQQCYFAIVAINIDYKKQVVMIGIKSDMQYLICQVLLYKYENLYKKYPKKYMSIY